MWPVQRYQRSCTLDLLNALNSELGRTGKHTISVNTLQQFYGLDLYGLNRLLGLLPEPALRTVLIGRFGLNGGMLVAPSELAESLRTRTANIRGLQERALRMLGWEVLIQVADLTRRNAAPSDRGQVPIVLLVGVLRDLREQRASRNGDDIPGDDELKAVVDVLYAMRILTLDDLAATPESTLRDNPAFGRGKRVDYIKSALAQLGMALRAPATAAK